MTRYHKWRKRLEERPLTRRERQVWKYVALGYTNEQTAKLLRITAYTVGTHRRNLHIKLGTHSIAQLVTRWYEARSRKRNHRGKGKKRT
jgi:DNA-binding CsgD family transcriptional regulator